MSLARRAFRGLFSLRFSGALRVHSSAGSQEIRRPPSRYTPRRALLFIPGNSSSALAQASKIQVDSLVLEITDSVAADGKTQARSNVRKYLDSLRSLTDHKCLELGVRVNSVASQMLHHDLLELAQSENLPEAFMVPKIDSIEDFATVFDIFRSVYGDKRILNTDTRLVIWIESARALLDMPLILNAAFHLHRSAGFFKLDGVAFGSDDFCTSIGANHSEARTECLFARQRFLTCCKAFRLQAIDSEFIDLEDAEGLRRECQEARNWGFDGKQVIDESQVAIVQSTFLPSPERVSWARELMRAYVQHEKTGVGAFVFDGRAVDRTLLLQAMNVVKLLDRVKRGRAGGK